MSRKGQSIDDEINDARGERGCIDGPGLSRDLGSAHRGVREKGFILPPNQFPSMQLVPSPTTNLSLLSHFVIIHSAARASGNPNSSSDLKFGAGQTSVDDAMYDAGLATEMTTTVQDSDDSAMEESDDEDIDEGRDVDNDEQRVEEKQDDFAEVRGVAWRMKWPMNGSIWVPSTPFDSKEETARDA